MRDAILLTAGYGRAADGRVLYRFGALDRPGGDRALTAVLAGARERVTVVSAFRADDLSPRRLATPGRWRCATYWRTSRCPAPSLRGDEAAADPLEAVVAERLRAAESRSWSASAAGRAGSRSPRAIRPAATGWSWRSTPTALPMPQRRLRATAIGCDPSTWSAWAGRSTESGLRHGPMIPTATERLLATYADAVTTADAYDWAEAAAQADAVVGMPDPGDEEPGDGVGITEGDGRRRGRRARAPGRGLRPRVAPGRAVGTYTRHELAAMARWVDSDGAARSRADLVDVLADELRLADRGPRVDDALRHAVRVARAGAPPLWTSPP